MIGDNNCQAMCLHTVPCLGRRVKQAEYASRWGFADPGEDQVVGHLARSLPLSVDIGKWSILARRRWRPSWCAWRVIGRGRSGTPLEDRAGAANAGPMDLSPAAPDRLRTPTASRPALAWWPRTASRLARARSLPRAPWAPASRQRGTSHPLLPFSTSSPRGRGC